LDILGLVVCAGLVGWVLYRWLKKSDEPARLISMGGVGCGEGEGEET